MQPVYVGLDFISARALEQSLMKCLGPLILINKIRGIAKNKIKPIYWTQAVISYMVDIAENEFLYWLGE